MTGTGRGLDRLPHELALSLDREVGNRRDEGIVFGNRGLLHVRQGRSDAARSAPDAGDALLRDAGARLDLTALPCARVETEHLAGDRDAACAALAEAESLAAEVGVGPDSEAGRALARVRALLERSAP